MKGGRPLLNGGNERLKLEKQRCSQLPGGEPHHEVLPGDMTAHETETVPSHRQAPFSWGCSWSQRGKGLNQRDKEVLQPEYQARWIPGLSQHDYFDVIITV